MRTSFEYELEYLDTIDDVCTETLTVDVEFTKHVDGAYGADADGNRGTTAVFVEDVEVQIFNENGDDVTKMIELEYQNDYEKILEQAEDEAAWAE